MVRKIRGNFGTAAANINRLWNIGRNFVLSDLLIANAIPTSNTLMPLILQIALHIDLALHLYFE